MQSNITRYCIHHFSDCSRIYIRVLTHIRHPIARPLGWSFVMILEKIDHVISTPHSSMSASARSQMNQRHIDRLVQERRNSIAVCTSSKEHVCILIKILLNIVLKCGPTGYTLTEQYNADQDLRWLMASPDRHYIDVIMTSQITAILIVYSSLYSGADQRNHQSSVSLAFVRGIHQSQMTPYMKNVSIWWRHHVITKGKSSAMFLQDTGNGRLNCWRGWLHWNSISGQPQSLK